MDNITIIPSSKINRVKWDACVANSSNGLIYASSVYLDAMAEQWYGLVMDDYATIFPLPIKKKLGFKYCYMPPFMQQLGFIGQQDFDAVKVVTYITQWVKYGSPYLNFGNQAFAEQQDCPSLSNYVVDLGRSYADIRKSYRKSIDYSLSKAAKLGLDYVADGHVEAAIHLYKGYNEPNMQHVTDNDYGALQELLDHLQQQGQVMIRKVLGSDHALLSIVLLLKDNKRYYNLINYTSEEGRKMEANYFLYDHVLRELSNQPMLFDFEGSDLPGVQSFYTKFGAVNQPFFHWHFNHLPLPMKLLKK